MEHSELQMGGEEESRHRQGTLGIGLDQCWVQVLLGDPGQTHATQEVADTEKQGPSRSPTEFRCLHAMCQPYCRVNGI